MPAFLHAINPLYSLSGLVVGAIAISVFMFLVSITNAAVLW